MSDLEKRVAALEREMQELRGAVRSEAAPKDWRSTVGMFAGDEVMRRVMDAALKYREDDRRKARTKSKAKPRRRKK